ncbi:histone H1 [Trifolium repens]|nr:histone H1 [Trifolium repens]
MAPKSSTVSHPTYEEMIKEAIVTLKEKTGSSQIAIAKFIEEKHKNLSPNFKKLLLQALKKNVASGKLVKVKSSFKLSPATKASEPKTKPAVAKPKTKPAAKVTAVKAKAAAKPKTKAVTKVVSKPKPAAAKPKAAVAKPKAAVAKPKAAASKPKAVAAKPKPKAGAKPAKASRTSTRTTPGKKVAASKAVVKKAVAAKKSPVKSKTVKSPAKKVSTKRVKPWKVAKVQPENPKDCGDLAEYWLQKTTLWQGIMSN